MKGLRDHLKEDELGIAKAEVEEMPKPGEEVKVEVKAEAKVGVRIEDLKPFSLEELGRFDGTGGKPIYTGYKGMVYDLSSSPLFQGEKRMRCHLAGKDLTQEMNIAPHGEDLVFKFPVVGR